MNPEDSKQFDEIMGRNFTRKETSRTENRAKQGAIDDAHDPHEVHENLEGLSRMAKFPSHMITTTEHGEYRVQHRSPRGWTHTWNGGPYIEHSNAKHGVVDVTNMMDYSKNMNEQHFAKGITPEEFMHHVNEFEKSAEQDYPKEYLP
jgi:hypothetical protein